MIFYVFQGKTYKQGRSGGYLWSPQTTSKGHKNKGYYTMTDVHTGDFILHHRNGEIVAISIANSDCYECDRPNELKDLRGNTNWIVKGYRVDCEYFDFDKPIDTRDFAEWLANHYVEGNAFNRNGTPAEKYINHLSDEQAVFLLEQAIEKQENKETLKTLKAALSEIKK